MNSNINFNNLSMIRGLAALYVVINHSRGQLFAGGSYLSSIKDLDWYDKINLALLQLTSLGHEAVILFFVLSGFSIAHSLSVNTNIFIFLRNRFIRIYPPYLISLLIALVVANLYSSSIRSQDYLSLSNVIYYMFYLKSNGGLTPQYWSLVYEIAFYLLAPIILLRSIMTNLTLIMSVSFFIYCYMFVSSDLVSTSDIMQSFFLDTLVYFMVGVFAYKNYFLCRRLIVSSKILFSTSFVLFFLLIVLLKKILVLEPKIISMLVALFTVYIIVNVNEFNIKSKALTLLGDISYSMYLNHFVVLAVIQIILSEHFSVLRSDLTSYYSWVLAVPICILFSYVTWFYIERQCSVYLHNKRNKLVAV